MRVTQVMLSKGFGGAERYYVDLSIALAEAGHEVHALSHARFAGRAALDAHPGVQHQTVNAWGRWDLHAHAQIRSAIAAAVPDVVHAHLARAAASTGRACASLGIPLVAKTHNYVDLKYYRNVDLFIPTTRDQARYLRENGIDAARIERIPNFSSIAVAERARPSRHGTLRVVAYGRLVEKKGYQDLLPAFRAALDAGVDARLDIGGDGPERGRLLELRERLGLVGAVELSGWVEDAAAFLGDADLFVLPSRLEPFGIVVLEAMAQGVPIVSTVSEGPSEILDHTCAYLAAVGDPASLANVMREAIRDGVERERRAARALALFRQHYARDAVVPQLVEVYARVSGKA